MHNWRNKILKALDNRKWTPLMFFALSCKDIKELEKLKDEILLLKNEGRITLFYATPEELLECVRNYYNKKKGFVDEKWKNMWLRYMKKNAKDLKLFFSNDARIKKK